MTAPAPQHLANKEYFNHYFVDFLTRHCGKIDRESSNIIKQLCQVTRLQHACLDLADKPAGSIKKLAALPFVGGPTGDEPLLLVNNKLFLHRYYHFERQVVEFITALNQSLPPQDEDLLEKLLDEHFATHFEKHFDQQHDIDLQRVAALLVVTRQFAIITGGPGTGKTSIVIKLLAMLSKLQPELTISMAAPTGKAAARLAESISQGAFDPATREMEVTTLHRLLGMRKDGRSWRHGPKNPIATDLLIVDEASMIDLALMHRLLHALPPYTRLVLIGDPHQLPSVDTGNILADLCYEDPVYTADFVKFAKRYVGDLPVVKGRGNGEQGTGSNRLANAVCRLKTNYRFNDKSSIGRLATGIKSGDAPFSSSDDGAVTFRSSADVTSENCGGILLEAWQGYFDLLAAKETSPPRLLAAFNQARVLCGHRIGFPGVVMINHAIERELEKRGIKTPGHVYYPGRPVMVTRNDYNLRLFNGDTGICVLMDGAERVAFSATAFPTTTGEIDYFPASRLPEHETCFAMTVHKSQGSEFDQVTLLLSDQPSPESSDLFTRELLYTAVTRTRSSIIIYGSEDLWHNMLRQSAVKGSGMFWHDEAH